MKKEKRWDYEKCKAAVAAAKEKLKKAKAKLKLREKENRDHYNSIPASEWKRNRPYYEDECKPFHRRIAIAEGKERRALSALKEAEWKLWRAERGEREPVSLIGSNFGRRR